MDTEKKKGTNCEVAGTITEGTKSAASYSDQK